LVVLDGQGELWRHDDTNAAETVRLHHGICVEYFEVYGFSASQHRCFAAAIADSHDAEVA
jgi:hypothetical protein